MERPDYRNGVIVGARRRTLVEELLAVREPIVLCAPAGYGKSAFARLLRSSGVAIPVLERRTYSMRARTASHTVIGARELAFDTAEIAAVLRRFSLAQRTVSRIEDLTRGWPAGVFYFARLAHLGALEGALSDLADPAFDDLYDYIDENIILPASRSQRLALIFDDRREWAPIVCAAMRLHHRAEFEAACAHRAKHAAVLLKRGSALDLESLSRLPSESLVSYPDLWLKVSAARLQRTISRDPRPILTVELFHGRVVSDGGEVPLVQRELAVLFMLAAAPQTSMDSRRLAAAIWPELDSEHGRTALKVAVSRLRSRLGNAGLVRYADGRYRLHESVHVDAAMLAKALDTAAHDLRDFEPVLGASRPPRLRDAEWFAPIESHLVELTHRLAAALGNDARSRGDARALLRIGHALLSADSCDETGCELVVRGHLLEGHADEARREYDRFVKHVLDEIGCVPSLSFEAVARA